MEKLTVALQLSVAVGMLLWAAFMIVRLVAGGYNTFYVICFGLIGLLGYNLLRVSVREMKGGGK